MSWQTIHSLPSRVGSPMELDLLLRAEIAKLQCGQCRNDGQNYINTNPVPMNREMWPDYLVGYHNHVNKITGKPKFFPVVAPIATSTTTGPGESEAFRNGVHWANAVMSFFST